VKFTVYLVPVGGCEVEVEASDKRGAEAQALANTSGFIVSGGHVEWEVDHVDERPDA
jgi:hypothetical protein